MTARIDPWLGIAAFGAAFVALVAGLVIWRARRGPGPEILRKSLHVGSGVLTLPFPFVFADTWPVVVLTSMAATLLTVMTRVPRMRRATGGAPTDVCRPTLGELYFPAAVAALFWLTRGRHPLLFVIPMLVLTFADAAAAVVGSGIGRHRFTAAGKSLEGSLAFATTSFLCIHAPLMLWGAVTPAAALLTALTLTLLLTGLEATARRGLDNLLVPLAGYFLLSALLSLDIVGLVERGVASGALAVSSILGG